MCNDILFIIYQVFFGGVGVEVIGTAVNARCERNFPSYHFECQRFGIPALSEAAIWSYAEAKLNL